MVHYFYIVQILHPKSEDQMSQVTWETKEVQLDHIYAWYIDESEQCRGLSNNKHLYINANDYKCQNPNRYAGLGPTTHPARHGAMQYAVRQDWLVGWRALAVMLLLSCE